MQPRFTNLYLQDYYEALAIYKETPSVRPNIAAVYEILWGVKDDQGLLEDALAASAEALKIRRRTLGDDHADTKRRMEAHRSLLKRLVENRSKVSEGCCNFNATCLARI